MDDVQLEERIDAGEQALEEQSKRPELQDLTLEVLTDLALHNWKCVASGVSVLDSSEPYRIIRWRNGDPNGEVEYGVILSRYWEPEAESELETMKIIGE